MKNLETKIKEIESDTQFKNKMRTVPMEEFDGEVPVSMVKHLNDEIATKQTKLYVGDEPFSSNNKFDPNHFQQSGYGLEIKQSSIWIIGEYKWVKIGTVMPAGWEKLDLPEGWTIVAGDSEGETWGKPGDGRENLFPEKDYHFNTWIGYQNTRTYFDIGRQVGIYAQANSETQDFIDTELSKANKAAGVFAELWQYTGKGV